MTSEHDLKRLKAGEAPTAPGTPALTAGQLELRAMVLDSVALPHSRRNYAKALDLLFAFAAGRPLTRALLMEYRSSIEGLAPSTVNVRLAAVRKLVCEARKNGMLSGEEADHLTGVPNIRQQGTRLGNWLTKEQAKELLRVATGRPSRANAITRSWLSWSAVLSGAGNWLRSPSGIFRCGRTAG